MKKDFAARLKQARIAAGYQYAYELADAIDEKIPTYRSWERGQYLPDIPKMARLCRVLRLPPNELVPLALENEKAASKAKGASGRKPRQSKMAAR